MQSLLMGGVVVIACIVFPILALLNIRVPNTQASTSLFSKDASNYFKGISAVLIFLAHIVQYFAEYGMNYPSILKVFEPCGGMGVLLFFFLSGYGLFIGYGAKMPGIDYWKKRFMGMYLPYIFMKSVVYLCRFLLFKKSFPLSELLIGLFYGDWFICVILAEYVLFFLVRRLDAILNRKEGKGVGKAFWIMLFTANVALGCLYYILHYNARWYNGLLLFPVGMVCAQYSEKLSGAFKNHSWLWTAFFAAVFCVTGFVFTKFKGAVWADLVKMLSGVFLSLLVATVNNFVCFGSAVMRAIGKRSLYVYIIHTSILYLFIDPRYPVFGFYILLISTIILTEVFYRFFQSGFFKRH